MESLVVSVDRVESILLDYAPDIAAEVLSRVWAIAKPSKPVRKSKAPAVPMHIKAMGEVSPQRCDRCETLVEVGEFVWQSVLYPAICCRRCCVGAKFNRCVPAGSTLRRTWCINAKSYSAGAHVVPARVTA